MGLKTPWENCLMISLQKLHLNLLKINLTGINFFQPSLPGLVLPAFRTRHWDRVARMLATPSGVPGYFHSPLARLGALPPETSTSIARVSLVHAPPKAVGLTLVSTEETFSATC